MTHQTSTSKLALVTGAGKRIGRSIALALAARGWDIAVHFGQSAAAAESVAEEIRALGRQAQTFACDLANEAEVKALLPRVQASMGVPSCVVNNASIFEHDLAHNFSRTALDQHMHINLMAPVLLAQSLHQLTADGAQACVVNILDQKLTNLNPDFFSYTLSKAALQCATTTLAQALAPKVRVVGVSPGSTLTSIHQSEANFAATQKISPLGYSSAPQDIAEAVCFLAQATAITGTTIPVDGGQHLMPLQRDVMFVVSTDPMSS